MSSVHHVLLLFKAFFDNGINVLRAQQSYRLYNIAKPSSERPSDLIHVYHADMWQNHDGIKLMLELA